MLPNSSQLPPGVPSDSQVPTTYLADEAPARAKRTQRALRAQLVKEHLLVKRSLGNAVLHAARAGAAIARLEESLLHGETTCFRAELCKELGISERTARLYLQIHHGWPAIQAAMERESLGEEPARFSLRQALAVVRSRSKKHVAPEVAQNLLPELSSDETSSDLSIKTGPLVDGLLSEREESKRCQRLVADAILEPALELIGGEFTIDATSEPECMHVPAELHYTENGLAEPWFDTVFFHLLGDAAIDPWIEKLACHLVHPTDRVTECVLVLPPLAGSEWFSKLMALGACVVFFEEPARSPGDKDVPRLVAYVGPNSKRFAELFGHLGPALRRMEVGQ